MVRKTFIFKLWAAAAVIGDIALLFGQAGPATAAEPIWDGLAGNPQHTALGPVATDPLQGIRWSTPVDTSLSGSGEVLIHYGSPMVTAENTVIVPVKTTSAGGFIIEALNGSTGGSPIWQTSTGYTFPTPYGWTPSYSPVLTPNNVLYYPDAGGTVDYRTNPDSAVGTTGQIAFYTNINNYNNNPSAYNGIAIDTPLTSDSSGDIYFGYRIDSPNHPAGMTDGIARIAPNGSATYMSVDAIASNPTVSANMVPGVDTVVMNSAPALSNNGKTLYVAVSNGPNSYSGVGDLVALNAATLAPTAAVELKDPQNGSLAYLPDDGSASPMVDPNGDVYMGTLENPFNSNNDRGFMLHYSADLTQTKTPGLFGWDDTASVVPASMVPEYKGSSNYLIMTKYNNYYGHGTGTGLNELAILDPNATETVNGTLVMNEVETVLGPTPDLVARADGYPLAVREWCINTALVDPATDSVLVNSEDGNLYRWDLLSDTLTALVQLTHGIGEAYTPTLEGADGSVYAIQNGTLYNVAPEPGTSLLLVLGAPLVIMRRKRRTLHH